jgi:hypothetical protein
MVRTGVSEGHVPSAPALLPRLLVFAPDVPLCCTACTAEHQPPTWSSYFTDLHIASLLAPAGLLLCFRPLTDASLFLLLYGVTAVYFSGVMVGAWVLVRVVAVRSWVHGVVVRVMGWW